MIPGGNQADQVQECKFRTGKIVAYEIPEDYTSKANNLEENNAHPAETDFKATR